MKHPRYLLSGLALGGAGPVLHGAQPPVHHLQLLLHLPQI